MSFTVALARLRRVSAKSSGDRSTSPGEGRWHTPLKAGFRRCVNAPLPATDRFYRNRGRDSSDRARRLHADVEILADAGGEVGETGRAVLRLCRIDEIENLLLPDGLHAQHLLGQVTLQAHDLRVDGC